MTTYLDKVHFAPLVEKAGVTTLASTLACGRAPLPQYLMRYAWKYVTCPACLAALKGKEELDDGSVRSDEVA